MALGKAVVLGDTVAAGVTLAVFDCDDRKDGVLDIVSGVIVAVPLGVAPAVTERLEDSVVVPVADGYESGEGEELGLAPRGNDRVGEDDDVIVFVSVVEAVIELEAPREIEDEAVEVPDVVTDAVAALLADAVAAADADSDGREVIELLGVEPTERDAVAEAVAEGVGSSVGCVHWKTTLRIFGQVVSTMP